MTDASQTPDSISLSDLQLLAQIVDLATSRGAFRGPELTTIGGIFDKLSTFLAFVQQQQEAAQSEDESALVDDSETQSEDADELATEE